jgi:hypothetical protein
MGPPTRMIQVGSTRTPLLHSSDLSAQTTISKCPKARLRVNTMTMPLIRTTASSCPMARHHQKRDFRQPHQSNLLLCRRSACSKHRATQHIHLRNSLSPCRDTLLRQCRMANPHSSIIHIHRPTDSSRPHLETSSPATNNIDHLTAATSDPHRLPVSPHVR